MKPLKPSLSFDLVNPLAADRFDTRRQRYKISGMSVMKSLQFFINCLLPLWILT